MKGVDAEDAVKAAHFERQIFCLRANLLPIVPRTDTKAVMPSHRKRDRK